VCLLGLVRGLLGLVPGLLGLGGRLGRLVPRGVLGLGGGLGLGGLGGLALRPVLGLGGGLGGLVPRPVLGLGAGCLAVSGLGLGRLVAGLGWLVRLALVRRGGLVRGRLAAPALVRLAVRGLARFLHG